MTAKDFVTLDIEDYHDLMTRAAYGDMVEPLIASLPVGLEDLMKDEDGSYAEEYMTFLMWSDPERWEELSADTAVDEQEDESNA